MKENRIYFKDDFMEITQADDNSDGFRTINVTWDRCKETIESKSAVDKLVIALYKYMDMRKEIKSVDHDCLLHERKDIK